MTKTNAERQAEYRKRRPTGGTEGNGERRLNTWISTEASLALERLSRHYAVTRREMLERLIQSADERIVKKLDLDTLEWDTYFGSRKKARSRVTR